MDHAAIQSDSESDGASSPRLGGSMRLRSLPLAVRIGLACAALMAPAVALAQDGLRVVPLVRQEHVLVSFNLTDGFTEEVRAAIQSGLKTTFTYAVDLRLDVPGWVDRTIGTATATSSVEFDNLTRRYDLVRMVDGRTLDSLQTED